MAKGIVIDNLTAVGTLTAAQQRSKYKNAQYSLNTSGDIVVSNSSLGLNGYNCIEIGLNNSVTPPKNITIKNCNFTGNLTNNAIIIFGTQDNAVINIKNCNFTKVSNMLRISNRTNASNVVINIENCEVTEYESNLQWRGIILYENYTDKTPEDAEANNRFAPSKIRINIKNLTSKGIKIEPKSISSVTNTGLESQIFVWCQDYLSDDMVPQYDKTRLPRIFINGTEIKK